MNRLLPVTSRISKLPLTALISKHSAPITIPVVHYTRNMATAALDRNTALPPNDAVSKAQVPAAAPAITPAQIAIVKATVPVLQQHGRTITELFYKNMLAAHPELRNMFNLNSQANGRQPQALAASVLAYASYIDDLPKLRGAVERIAHKHASLHVVPEQYAIVGEHLLGAIGAVLGDAATPAIVDAWTTAYGVLADVLTGREKSLYAEHANWVGWRKFRIARREVEAEGITSFYLAPVDGAKLPTYQPGQYVSLQVYLPEHGVSQSRQYSLSTAPREAGDYYRVSIKREEYEDVLVGGTGSISTLLFDRYQVGDEVELTHPQGEYFVDVADKTKEAAPLVLISAGVGATPNVSILESAVQPGTTKRPVSWLQASQTKAMLPFSEDVRRIQQEHPEQVSTHTWLRAIEGDMTGVDFDHDNCRMDLSQVDKDKDLFAGNAAAEYYICGPERFMMDTRRTLESMGVDRDRIRLELFSTGDVA